MDSKHDFSFDPTNGMTLEELLAIPASEPPADYEAFWRETRNLAMSFKPVYYIEKELWSPEPGTRIYQLHAKLWDGAEIGLWIARPEHSRGGLLIGQGYGNPSQPFLPWEGLTTCMPCIRGLGLSQCREIPWQFQGHILHGISRKESYILRGAVTDLWSAATILCDMFPDTAENLNYQGRSMGGGTGALMLAWENRFRAAYLDVPAFGTTRRFHYQSTGSGETCRQYLQTHPEALKVLSYFDASVSAKYIHIPVIVTPAKFDPCVTPVEQFSVANSIPAENRFMEIMDTGHLPPTEEDKVRIAKTEQFRKELFLKHAVC